MCFLYGRGSHACSMFILSSTQNLNIIFWLHIQTCRNFDMCALLNVKCRYDIAC
ncbi:hypothetical protein PRUPE_1G543100 [Prunus persica]|uniref:Uncharacterized protein n=1 Tax=Prunus persica TaxID=3760 RepID=A0A251RHL3_PRUPE|nr:hypothetical protein PRUPE_1G543100 [Prunus persica]